MYPLRFTCLLLISTLTAAQLPVDNRTLTQIYAAAQKENGTLRVSLGGSSFSAGTALRNAWAQNFPLVKLNLTVDASKYVDGRIDKAFERGELYTDVAYLETVQDYPRWKREGRLLNYKPPNFDDVNTVLRDSGGAYVAGQIYQFGPFYFDETRVPGNRIPRNYLDILDPYWKGKLVLEYPNDDDGSLYLFSLIIQRYGWSWLERLYQQDVLWLRGAAGPAYTINNDNNTTNASRTLTFTTLGYSLGSTTFKKTYPQAPERFMSWAQTCAIFRETKVPESAKLFEAFLLSDEYQSTLITTSPSVRNSLITQPIQNVFMQNNTEVSGYTAFMMDRANVEWWRNQVESVIGTAAGPDPIYVYPPFPPGVG